MTIYATFNPIGSTNPKDLIDNAQNLDLLILGPLLSYPDRRGVNRLSWAGIEAAFAAAQASRASTFTTTQATNQAAFDTAQTARATTFTATQAAKQAEYDAAQVDRENRFNMWLDLSGFENPPLVYTDGVTLKVDRVTQLIQRSGNLYTVKRPATFPKTLTGTWATDAPGLVLRNDQSIRQDLADPTVGGLIIAAQQTGAGAAARTVADKVREFPSLADYGGAGDWNGATGADNKAALDKLLAAHAVAYVLPGRWRCGAAVDVPAGKKLVFLGGGELVFTSGSLRMAADTVADHAFISGNGKTNAASGLSIVAGANNVLLNRPKVRSVYGNGIDNSSGAHNLQILNPDLSDIGGTGIDPTFQGMGVYSQGGNDLRVEGGEIQRTYGQGAIFISGGARPTVRRVNIHDTFYRGIELFNNPTGALVGWNEIRRTGEINTSGSGVGCNGIYSIVASQKDAMIIGNIIEDCAENGIEGNGTIIGNTVTRTGYRNLSTPSKEGIFLNTRAICKGNTITGAAGDGIKFYSSVSGQETEIYGNTIVDPVGSGITAQVDGAGVVFGKLNIDGNTVYGANDPSKFGVNVFRSNGAVFDLANSFVNNNKVFGRANNSVSSFIGVVSGNSFDPTVAYFGDATGTASKAKSFTMVFNAPVTTIRAALANTANPSKGDILRVVRAATATGAFAINITSGSAIKPLTAAGQWADVVYDGAAWVLVAFGSL
jgi:hypothetical protein